MNTHAYKEKLEKELSLVTAELEKIARRNPQSPEDWEPMETVGNDKVDDDSVADNLEDFANNTALVAELEAQYDNVKIALRKIADGTYGKCEVGGEDISEERLEVMPSARTCVEHA